MEMSQKNGWHFYASVAPPSRRDALVGVNPQPHSFTTALGNPLQHHPCVLMLGGEGAGIRPDLQKRADHLVSIAGQRSGRGGVDSLNVSVAGGVLCDAFLRQPTAHSIDPQASSNETSHARFEGDLF